MNVLDKISATRKNFCSKRLSCKNTLDLDILREAQNIEGPVDYWKESKSCVIARNKAG